MPFRAVIFDYANTLSSAHYFTVPHPAVPDWTDLIQSEIFGDDAFFDRWMRGEERLATVAGRLSRRTGQRVDTILECLVEGCRGLAENPGVAAFARRLKAAGVPIALVTGNVDVFTEVVVPAHGYDRLFDTVLNTSDYGTLDKRDLWPRAFSELGDGIGYHNTLLIEDGAGSVDHYRRAGGHAIQYTTDRQLEADLAGYRIADGMLVEG